MHYSTLPSDVTVKPTVDDGGRPMLCLYCGADYTINMQAVFKPADELWSMVRGRSQPGGAG
jgi:hypothetical protein